MQYETRGCDEHKEDKIEIVVGFPPTEPTDVNRKNIKIKYAVEVSDDAGQKSINRRHMSRKLLISGHRTCGIY